MTQYTVKAPDAAAMVSQWYQLAGNPNPSPKAVAWWTKQIQQDGSHTAFLNFSNGKGQDAQSQFNPQTLIANVAASTKQNGYAPWQPNAQTPQYPGTNTKSGGAIIGSALDSPVGKIIEDVAAAALDFVTAGAATPFTTAGLAALQGGGKALQPGENFGSIAKEGASGAASGIAAGGLAGLAGSAGLPGFGALSAAPDAATMTPGALSTIANAGSSPAAVNSALGLPNIGAVTAGGAINTAKQVAGAVGANGLPSAGPVSGSSGGIGDLLNSLGTTIPAVLQGANATNLQNKSNQYADDAINTQKGLWDSQAPLRAAGISGMLNPSTPAPGLPNIAALNTAAAKGNPFATPVPLPIGEGAPSAPVGLPTAGPIGAPTGAPAMPTPPIIRPPVPPLGSLPSAGPVAGGGGAQAPSNLVY